MTVRFHVYKQKRAINARRPNNMNISDIHRRPSNAILISFCSLFSSLHVYIAYPSIYAYIYMYICILYVSTYIYNK